MIIVEGENELSVQLVPITPSPVILSGRIMNEEGSPLGWSDVFVYPPPYPEAGKIRIKADGQGYYKADVDIFGNVITLEPGEYYIQAATLDLKYEIGSQWVTLGYGMNIVDFYLPSRVILSATFENNGDGTHTCLIRVSNTTDVYIMGTLTGAIWGQVNGGINPGRRPRIVSINKTISLGVGESIDVSRKFDTTREGTYLLTLKVKVADGVLSEEYFQFTIGVPTYIGKISSVTCPVSNYPIPGRHQISIKVWSSLPYLVSYEVKGHVIYPDGITTVEINEIHAISTTYNFHSPAFPTAGITGIFTVYVEVSGSWGIVDAGTYYFSL